MKRKHQHAADQEVPFLIRADHPRHEFISTLKDETQRSYMTDWKISSHEKT